LQIETEDVLFLSKFQKHLSYYENKLFPNSAEKLYKTANLVFYSLVLDKPLDIIYIQRLLGHDWKCSFREDDLATTLAFEYLEQVVATYNSHFKTRPLIELIKPEATCLGGTVRNKINNFVEWQESLYGIPVLSKVMLLDELLSIKDGSAKTPGKATNTEMTFTQIQDFLTVLFKTLSIPLPKIAFQGVPDYLSSVIPIAGAYWFNRLDTDSQSFKVLINVDKKIPLGMLLMVVTHEVLGHINHFNLINTYCSDNAKKLPYLSRFPITEGVALLAEDALLNLSVQNNMFLQVVRTIFRLEGVENEHIKNEILEAHKDARRTRILRCLFELDIYREGKNPNESIGDLAQVSSRNPSDLKEDLYSFLYTPGYASCYIGGYKLLLGKTDLTNENERRKLGAFGFNFVQNLP